MVNAGTYVQRADRKKSAIEVGAHRGTPAQGVGGDGAADLALDAGAADETVEVRPDGGDLGGGALDLRPVGDIATRGVEDVAVL